eukprot:TRINITY_DN8035_c0_g1_i2.p1 TRINITY_DN8035_c0_g1~~TRINITY_DN8035_c0_g1_i2.p1  ORF type:complete len:202 (+),score=65.76 TRINITY_DN8035_c0_g1_i2:143-748(+)
MDIETNHDITNTRNTATMNVDTTIPAPVDAIMEVENEDSNGSNATIRYPSEDDVVSFRNRYYQELNAQTQAEIDQIRNGEHPTLTEIEETLNNIKGQKIWKAEQWELYEKKCIENQRQEMVDAAEREYRKSLQEEKDKLIQKLQNRQVGDDVDAPKRRSTRRGRGNDNGKDKDYLDLSHFSLTNKEIQEDFQLILDGKDVF